MSIKFIIGGMLVVGSGAIASPPVGCAATTCLTGYTCVEDANGAASCVENSPPTITCANVRCSAGTTCVEKKNGDVACLADCVTSCGVSVPHGWKGHDDGSNCCNKCRCNDGNMRCRNKNCDSCGSCGTPLGLSETCYQFCEDSSCEFIDRRNDCEKGECTADSGIGFNSHSTCRLQEGATCYQFCEDGSCAPINDSEHCADGLVCRDNGEIGFNSHLTCQTPL